MNLAVFLGAKVVKVPNKANQKLRLLCLLEIFIKKTSVGTGLTTSQLLDELTNIGIEAERKSIYRDIKAMKEFGLEVEQNREHQWYLINRPFSQDELVMLVDAVQSTPFLTPEMSSRLIERISRFASTRDEKVLGSRMGLLDYVKMSNEDVFWNLDAAQKAIAFRKKLSFKYFRYGAVDGRLMRVDTHDCLVTPLGLAYADEKYYLLAFDERHDDTTPYRVDRMVNTKCTNDPIPKRRGIDTWRIEHEVVPSFGVFEAEVVPITLDVRNEWLNTVVDKFGEEIDVYTLDDATIRAYVKAPLSPQFFGWLFQLGNHVKLAAPKKAIEEYKGYCEEILLEYSAG